MDAPAESTGLEPELDDRVPAWRERALSRTLDAARSRAEERVERFLEAAFALVDDNESTDFTIQDVVERSKQSLRGFYECFDGKDELLLAMFEEILYEAEDDLRVAVAAETDPLDCLRAFTIGLHEWCDPVDVPRKRGSHKRRPISEYAMRLTGASSDRVQAAIAPLSRTLFELIGAAVGAGAIQVPDARRATAIVLQTVMLSSFGNRLVDDPDERLTAEETWDFCLHGLSA